MGLQILFGARRPEVGDGPASGGDGPASEAEALVVTYLLNNDPWTQACRPPTPFTLHPTPFTLHPTPCTLHP